MMRPCASMSINPYVPTRSHSRMMNIGRDLRHYLPAPTRSRSESLWCVRWRACRPGGGAPLDLLLDLGPDITNTDSFAEARGVPSACKGCSYVGTCGGGCAGRRRLPQAEGADGEEPRTSQARKRLHDDRDGTLNE